MPTEIRHIIFRPAEMVDAIVAYHRARGLPLPTGVVEDCAVVETAGAAVGFRISIKTDRVIGPGASEPATLSLSGSDLIAALIGYCKSCSIPVPLKGSKVLERFGTQLGLVITIGR